MESYNRKLYSSRRPTIAGYGYHRRRLRINQESRGSKNRSSSCVKSGKHNLVSSSVHRNLLTLILVSFIPLLLIQGMSWFSLHFESNFLKMNNFDCFAWIYTTFCHSIKNRLWRAFMSRTSKLLAVQRCSSHPGKKIN